MILAASDEQEITQNVVVLVVERYLDLPLPHSLSITFTKYEEALPRGVPLRRLFDPSPAIMLSDSCVQDSLTTNLAAADGVVLWKCDIIVPKKAPLPLKCTFV
jgi:hypothetical protein